MDSKIIKAMLSGTIGLLSVCLPNCTPQPSSRGLYPSPEIKPGVQVLNAFAGQYPDAENITWSIEKEYYVATFTLMSAPANAWFDESGECLLSVKEHPFEQLGREISEAFFSSSYAGWKVEHVNLLERVRMGHLYTIRVTDSSCYRDMYYSRLGDLVRVYAHAGNYVYYPITIPPKINRIIDSLFDKPEIIDIWKGALSINVAILDSTLYQYAAFTSDQDWICTFWEVSKEKIPPKVWEGFSLSEFGAYPVDLVRLLRNDTQTFYLFYFTNTDNKIRHVLYMKENGALHGLVSY
jgi:hypothetical protein